MSYILPPLPYPMDALEPHISRETIHYHYEKHHQAYVDRLNQLNPEGQESLEYLIQSASGALFNQAAQVWNHSFYWHSMSAQHHQKPMSQLHAALTTQFGDLDRFYSTMNQAALGQFGSGWAWLVAEQGTLHITTTSNADNPLRAGQDPLLVIDVWEHAYYIDARHQRARYLEQFWCVANWAFAEQNYLRHLAKHAATAAE